MANPYAIAAGIAAGVGTLAYIVNRHPAGTVGPRDRVVHPSEMVDELNRNFEDSEYLGFSHGDRHPKSAKVGQSQFVGGGSGAKAGFYTTGKSGDIDAGRATGAKYAPYHVDPPDTAEKIGEKMRALGRALTGKEPPPTAAAAGFTLESDSAQPGQRVAASRQITTDVVKPAPAVAKAPAAPATTTSTTAKSTTTAAKPAIPAAGVSSSSASTSTRAAPSSPGPETDEWAVRAAQNPRRGSAGGGFVPEAGDYRGISGDAYSHERYDQRYDQAVEHSPEGVGPAYNPHGRVMDGVKMSVAAAAQGVAHLPGRALEAEERMEDAIGIRTHVHNHPHPQDGPHVRASPQPQMPAGYQAPEMPPRGPLFTGGRDRDAAAAATAAPYPVAAPVPSLPQRIEADASRIGSEIKGDVRRGAAKVEDRMQRAEDEALRKARELKGEVKYDINRSVSKADQLKDEVKGDISRGAAKVEGRAKAAADSVFTAAERAGDAAAATAQRARGAAHDAKKRVEGTAERVRDAAHDTKERVEGKIVGAVKHAEAALGTAAGRAEAALGLTPGQTADADSGRRIGDRERSGGLQAAGERERDRYGRPGVPADVKVMADDIHTPWVGGSELWRHTPGAEQHRYGLGDAPKDMRQGSGGVDATRGGYYGPAEDYSRTSTPQAFRNDAPGLEEGAYHTGKAGGGYFQQDKSRQQQQRYPGTGSDGISGPISGATGTGGYGTAVGTGPMGGTPSGATGHMDTTAQGTGRATAAGAGTFGSPPGTRTIDSGSGSGSGGLSGVSGGAGGIPGTGQSATGPAGGGYNQPAYAYSPSQMGNARGASECIPRGVDDRPHVLGGERLPYQPASPLRAGTDTASAAGTLAGGGSGGGTTSDAVTGRDRSGYEGSYSTGGYGGGYAGSDRSYGSSYGSGYKQDQQRYQQQQGYGGPSTLSPYDTQYTGRGFGVGKSPGYSTDHHPDDPAYGREHEHGAAGALEPRSSLPEPPVAHGSARYEYQTRRTGEDSLKGGRTSSEGASGDNSGAAGGAGAPGAVAISKGEAGSWSKGAGSGAGKQKPVAGSDTGATGSGSPQAAREDVDPWIADLLENVHHAGFGSDYGSEWGCHFDPTAPHPHPHARQHGHAHMHAEAARPHAFPSASALHPSARSADGSTASSSGGAATADEDWQRAQMWMEQRARYLAEEQRWIEEQRRAMSQSRGGPAAGQRVQRPDFRIGKQQGPAAPPLR